MRPVRRTCTTGIVRGDPLSQLQLAVGRADPHAVYERMRATGPLLPTRLGNLSTTSHAVCQQVLRNRAFGVNDPDAPRPGEDMLDLSLLALNPPDHTRLRRLAAPAFTPRRMAGYEALVEASIDRLLDAVDRARRRIRADVGVRVAAADRGHHQDAGPGRRAGPAAPGRRDGGVGAGRRAVARSRAAAVPRRPARCGRRSTALLERAATEPGDDLTRC